MIFIFIVIRGFFFSITASGLVTICGLITFFGLLTAFGMITTSGLVTICGLSIVISNVLIIFLVAVTLKLFSKDFIVLLDTLFWSISSLF